MSLEGSATASIAIDRATIQDVPRVIEIDAAITGQAKTEFWYEFYTRQTSDPRRSFLVAHAEGEVAGYIIGVVRAWEFGSPPCGWIHAVGVDARYRQLGVATVLFEHIVAHFRQQGIATIRTMLHIDDHSLISFFRFQGMSAGPFIELEMALD